VYICDMDVAVAELRANLAHWIDTARDGEDVVITDRGTPVARIVALEASSVIDDLTEQGVISRPISSVKPQAGQGKRPRPRSSVADLVSEQRR
jgi:prevent-host-death family protein